MAKELGEPFTLIPTEMFAHFSAGIASWGSICGCLSVAASAIGMVTDQEYQSELTRQLFAWYKEAEHPTYLPPGEDEMPQAIVNSVLCHVSVTKWLNHAGEDSFSGDGRGERCARVTASTAKFAIEKLNELKDGEFETAYSPSAEVGICMDCHGDEGYGPVSHGSDSCLECHDTDLGEEHYDLDIEELKQDVKDGLK